MVEPRTSGHREGRLLSDLHGLADQPFDSYFEQVYRTNNGRYSEAAFPAMGTLRIASNVLVGAARAPSDWIYNSKRFNDSIFDPTCEFLVADPELKADDASAGRAAACVERGTPSYRAKDGAISNSQRQVIFSDRVNEGPQGWGDAVKLSATVVPRVLLIPLADGFGEEAWKNMRRRTQRTIRAEFELDGEGEGWLALRQRYPRGEVATRSS